jgi:D-alanine-D-alanine ligase
MAKPIIAFVTGGYSSEDVISYKSAINIEKFIDREKYEVYRIDITPQSWFHKTPEGAVVPVDKHDFSLRINDQRIRFDAVFIGIHGTPGEDGKLQGYLDMMGLPYTSCDVTSSAITFNKRYTVAVAGASGYHVARSKHLFKHSFNKNSLSQLGLRLPVFVKPNNGGSSIGMSKVHRSEELESAIEKAFLEDDQVLVEEYIQGREFTIGVYRSKGKSVTLPFTEIISENDFFDFEAKYQGKSSEVTPAECTDVMTKQIQEAAKGIYDVFNCRGVVRMDFIYSPIDNAPYLLEINTIPGQTAASIIPQQVAAAGMQLGEFYTLLIEEALSHKKKD